MGCGGLSKIAQPESGDISDTTNFVSNVIQLQSSVLLPVVASNMMDRRNPSENQNSTEASVNQTTETPVFSPDDRNEVQVINNCTNEFKLNASTCDIEFLPKAFFTKKQTLSKKETGKNYLSSQEPELNSPVHQSFNSPQQKYDFGRQESNQEKMELTEVLLFSTSSSPESTMPDSQSLDKLQSNLNSPVDQLPESTTKSCNNPDCEEVYILSSTFESRKGNNSTDEQI